MYSVCRSRSHRIVGRQMQYNTTVLVMKRRGEERVMLRFK